MFQEAMNGPHGKSFKEAIQKEIEALEMHRMQQRVLKSSLPNDTKVVPLLWAFRIKQNPNGDFDRFKACLVVRGDLQNNKRETSPHCQVV